MGREGSQSKSQFCEKEASSWPKGLTKAATEGGQRIVPLTELVVFMKFSGFFLD